MALNKECFQLCCGKRNKGIRELSFTSLSPISNFFWEVITLAIELITKLLQELDSGS